MSANPSPAAPVLRLAWGNENKRVELGRMLEGLGCRLESLQRHPDVPEEVEDGRTFAENARSKALHYASRRPQSTREDSTVTVASAAPASVKLG